MTTKMLLLMVFLAWLIPNQWIFSVELEKYDPDKAAAFERLKTKMTQPDGARLLVSYSLLAWLNGASTFVPGRVIFFSPVFVDREDFLVIAAHELGHIEYKTSNQVLADLFAMKFANKEKMMNFREKNGYSPDYLNAINTCYESNGKNCPDVSGSSFTYTLIHIFKQFLNSFQIRGRIDSIRFLFVKIIKIK